MPQFSATGAYPNLLSPFDLSVLTQFTYFQKSPTNTEKAVNGQRFIFNPKIALPMTTSYSFVTPSVIFNMSNYHLQNNQYTPSLATQYPNDQVSEVIPQFALDSGLYFERNFSLLGQKYHQSLEPHVMYLFTPFESQSDIPDFDTSPVSFDYDQLFALNRFSGYDRIGDTNQLTYALSSTVDDHNGAQVLSAGVGQIHYFRKRNVTLCYPGDTCIVSENPNYDRNSSHIAGFINYNYNQNWHFQFSEAYNTHTSSLQYQNYNLQYLADPRHVFNVGYSLNRQDYALLTRQQILDGNAPPKSAQLNLSSIWKFTPMWHALGAWNYSTDKQKTISEFGAIELNECSWAFRFGIYRYLLTSDPNNPSDLSGHLRNTFMFQFIFKGLGGIGPSSLETLAQQIPGYSKQSGF